MGKTRLLLLLVFAIFGSLGLFLWERGFYEFAVLIPSVPMISSLFLFLFSFFKVDKNQHGELCFKESNPYLRLMRLVFNCDSLNVDQISICKLHVFSMILVVFGAFVVFALFIVCVIAYSILSGEAKFHLDFLNFFVALGVVCIIIGTFILFIRMMTSKKRWLSNLATFLFVLIFGGVCFFILVVLPIFKIMEIHNLSLLWAIAYYLGFVLAIIGAIAAVVFLVIVAVKYIPALKETWLGQIFLSAYSGLCPMIRLEVSEER